VEPVRDGGTWFAADPQSGWLSLSTMGTSVAVRMRRRPSALIVLNPILAGLGVLWFLRKEGLGRVAATAGGLSLAMAISASIVAISLPFAGRSRGRRSSWWERPGSSRPSGWRRLAWLALARARVGAGRDVAPVARTDDGDGPAGRVRDRPRDPRGPEGELRTRRAPVDVARLPRVRSARESRDPDPPLRRARALEPVRGVRIVRRHGRRSPLAREDIPIPDTGIWGAWPLALAIHAGWLPGSGRPAVRPVRVCEIERARYLSICLGVVFAVAYVLTSTVLVGAGWFRSLALALPFGDVYLHNPGRLRYLAFLIVPVLGAIGIHWVLEHRPSFGEAMRWIGAGLAVFLAIPLLMGARAGRLTVFAIASAAVVGVVWAIARGRRWAPVALCARAGAELAAGALWSSMYHGGTVYLGLESGSQPRAGGRPAAMAQRRPERVPRARSRRAVSETQRGRRRRYLAWIAADAQFNKGYLFTRKPPDWPALLIGRSVLFELPDTLGYSPVQIPGYWSYIHGINKLPVFYNASVIQVPTLSELRVLGARYLITRDGDASADARGPDDRQGGRVSTGRDRRRRAARDARSDLGGGCRAGGRRWTPRSSRASTRPGSPSWRPTPGLVPREHGLAGHAYYHELEPEDVRIDVDAPDPSILVVRNAWDEGWSATLDGRSVPMLRSTGSSRAWRCPGASSRPAGLPRAGDRSRDRAVGARVAGPAGGARRGGRSGRRAQASGAPVGDDGSVGTPTGSTGA
jgi:hypothetical protein